MQHTHIYFLESRLHANTNMLLPKEDPLQTDSNYSTHSIGSNGVTLQSPPSDAEKQEIEQAIQPDKVSAFKGLGWLDRFLAIWIILAMAIGILLGNFVPATGPALERGKFVGVSVPIGISSSQSLYPQS